MGAFDGRGHGDWDRDRPSVAASGRRKEGEIAVDVVSRRRAGAGRRRWRAADREGGRNEVVDMNIHGCGWAVVRYDDGVMEGLAWVDGVVRIGLRDRKIGRRGRREALGG